MDRNRTNVFPIIKSIAEASLKAQVINDGDRWGPDGMLICGVCGEPKRELREIADPLPGNENHTSWIMVPKDCFCVREILRKDVEEKNYKLLWDHSLMEEKYRNATFENAIINEYNGKNIKRCRKYAEGFDEMYKESQGLLLYGDVGTGKSWSAACICNYLIRRGIKCIMISPIQILKFLEEDPEKAKEIHEKILKYSLVVIDELGAERNTGYSSEKVYGIINDRLLTKKPMVITTNNLLEDMKREEDDRLKRIYDRIFETCFPMKFEGPSWRRVEANKRFERMTSFFNED